MRKIFALAAVLVGLAGCAESGRYVDVRFGVDVLGLETKSVQSTLRSLEPRMSDLSDVVFEVGGEEVHVGDRLTLLEGVYEVTGEYEPWLQGLSFGGHRVAEQPAFIVADEVEVRAGDEEIVAHADWNCWALMVDLSEVEKVYFDGLLIVMGGDDQYGVFFVEACQGNSWVLQVVPSSDDDKVTEWTIEADERARAGKWYLYHPDGKVEVSGGFGVEFDDWVAGNE